jgi:hypothetical protein
MAEARLWVLVRFGVVPLVLRKTAEERRLPGKVGTTGRKARSSHGRARVAAQSQHAEAAL